MGPRSRRSETDAAVQANAEIVGAAALNEWDRVATVDADAYIRWVETGEGEDPCPDFSE